MINRYWANDINACREWLRMAGLKLDLQHGWIDASEGGRRIGWINYTGNRQAQWCASITYQDVPYSVFPCKKGAERIGI